MGKIRVAHLIYSEKVGGSEMVASNVCSYLDRSTFDPLVLFMLRSTGDMPEILQQLHVPGERLNMFWRSLPFESYYISYLLNRMQVDILHVHHVPLYLRVAKAVQLSGVKGVIITEHAKFSIEQSEKLQEGCRRAAQEVNYFTTVSTDLKNYFVQDLHIPASSIHVVPNGVDVKRFNPGKRNSILRLMVPGNFTGKIIIHVGRLAEAKDHVTLLKAIRQVVRNGRELYLFLVGDGELRQEIANIIAELRLDGNVKMLGMRSDVDTLLLGADLFVMSSKREGLPMVLMEAMACGLPVVSTKVGGIAEIIKDKESGLLVEPERPDLLAKAIEYVFESRDTGALLGQQARAIILEKYSLATAAKSYVQMYEQILSNGTPFSS